MTQPQYNIVEIFSSLQGEGFNTGMPSIFIRFGKCNLACPWCDTNYNQFERWSLSRILAKVRSYSPQNIIITGGEPTIQPQLGILLDRLKTDGYFIAIETNGLKPIPPQIDYVATSPKRLYQHKYQQRCIPTADEVRIVNDGDILPFCLQIEQKIHAAQYYLSPCEQHGEMNLFDTIQKLGQLNQHKRHHHKKWQLSLQTHKLIGIE